MLQEGEEVCVAIEEVGRVAGEAEIFGLQKKAGIQGETGLAALAGSGRDALLARGEERVAGERGGDGFIERERLLSGQ